MASVPVSVETRRKIFQMLDDGFSQRKISQATGVSQGMVSNIKIERSQTRPDLKTPVTADLPPGKHEDIDVSGLPDPFPQTFTPFPITDAGHWLVISDIHVPYHDKTTVSLAIAAAKRRGVKGVILNGDIADCHELSDHDKDPRMPRYIEELQTAKQLLAWIRKQLPGVRIFYKEGYHENRLTRYLTRKAPAFFGLEAVSWPSLLDLKTFGVEWVADKRTITLGRLNIIHGHEYRGGVSSPVNPARGLYLKARSVAMAGHHHQTSEHHARDIRGRAEAAWSLGCACFLSPEYMPHNNWNFGFALAELSSDGEFMVENKRVLGGKIV